MSAVRKSSMVVSTGSTTTMTQPLESPRAVELAVAELVEASKHRNHPSRCVCCQSHLRVLPTYESHQIALTDTELVEVSAVRKSSMVVSTGSTTTMTQPLESPRVIEPVVAELVEASKPLSKG